MTGLKILREVYEKVKKKEKRRNDENVLNRFCQDISPLGLSLQPLSLSNWLTVRLQLKTILIPDSNQAFVLPRPFFQGSAPENKKEIIYMGP